MLRSILVALDGSASSLNAAHCTFDLAKRFDAHVEALGIVNAPSIRRPEPIPLGAAAWKLARDDKREAEATVRVSSILDRFREEAGRAELASVVAREVDGSPVAIIQREATASDLVVIGRDSLFDEDGDLYDFPLCVERIIRTEPRPVLLVPPEEGAIIKASAGPVLIAYDGSPAASRALHMFALLGLGSGRVIHIVTLDDESPAAATATADRAGALLRRHGLETSHAIGLGDKEAGSPSETILGLARALEPSTVVMGAYGHRGLQEVFGSCTRNVVRACPVPLFLHH